MRGLPHLCNCHPLQQQSGAPGDDTENMGKRRTPKQAKGTIPESIQYRALVSMSRAPSVRDLKRRARKAARLDLKKGEYDA